MSDSIPPTSPGSPPVNPNDDSSNSSPVQNQPSSQVGSNSKSGQAQNFFPDMPMSKAEFHKFMSNLLSFISAQIQTDQEHMKQALDDLKKSETDDE